MSRFLAIGGFDARNLDRAVCQGGMEWMEVPPHKEVVFGVSPERFVTP